MNTKQQIKEEKDIKRKLKKMGWNPGESLTKNIGEYKISVEQGEILLEVALYKNGLLVEPKKECFDMGEAIIQASMYEDEIKEGGL